MNRNIPYLNQMSQNEMFNESHRPQDVSDE